MGIMLGSDAVLRPLIPFLKEPWTSKSKYPAILIETFLYGLHVVLFSYCIIIIAKQKLAQRMFLSTLIMLFSLASADIAITLYFFFHYVLSEAEQEEGGESPWSRTLMYKFAVYVVANAIVSGLLIYRCYTVWRNKRILIAPTVLAISGTVISFASIKATQLGDRLLAASFITSATANLSVTLFIAIRMWSSRKVRPPMKIDLFAVISFMTSLILDSGAIYSLSIFLYLLLHTLVLDACLTQIAGVTVTTIILRNFHDSEVLDDNTTFGTIATIQSDMQ